MPRIIRITGTNTSRLIGSAMLFIASTCLTGCTGDFVDHMDIRDWCFIAVGSVLTLLGVAFFMTRRTLPDISITLADDKTTDEGVDVPDGDKANP